MKKLLLATAAVALMAIAGHASAATLVTVTDLEMSTSPPVIQVNNGFVTESVYAAPFEVTIQGSVKTLLAWCIDEIHNSSLGLQNGSYLDESLAEYLGPSFDVAKWTEIAGQIQYGASLPFGPNINFVQPAIWQTLLPGSATTSDVAFSAQFNGLASANLVGNLDSIRVLKSLMGAQDIAYTVSVAVPEPATWVMMIGGFFGLGTMLRRRRPVLALA